MTALHALGIPGDVDDGATGPWIESHNPTTEALLGRVRAVSRADYDARVAAAQERFASWRLVPAPRRGELVARLGQLLRQHKSALGELVSLEMGKIRSEGLGEVQEMIDICDFAVGLSRQLHGLTIASERPRHRMMEQWHPLGPVAVITAFNFPVAVWAWNAALAAVCGDAVLWKPSPHTPLCAAAVHRLCRELMDEFEVPGLFQLTPGGAEVGRWMAEDRRLPLVSFTGSTEVGRQVAAQVGQRLGRTILELGGNNGLTVLDDASLELATRAIVFGAAGTAGQRCTSTRRVFAQRGIIGRLSERLVAAYRSIRIGDPLGEGVLVGPLVNRQAVERYRDTLARAQAQGAELLCGGKILPGPGHFVEPAILRAPHHEDFPVAWEETFAPLLYLFEVADLDQALRWNNAVAQGLSSALFTDSVRAAEQFLSAAGSDCGIANINLGTSGAEIGGAFGGEKDTGGGRESGSDAWKGYMRRQTCTVNGGDALPLAQGVEFL